MDSLPRPKRSRHTGLTRYGPLVFLPVLAAAGWFGSQPLTITLLYGATWATFAVGYDMFFAYFPSKGASFSRL